MNEVPMYITQHRGEILSRYEKDMFDILSKICYRLEPDEIMEGIEELVREAAAYIIRSKNEKEFKK